MKCDLDDGKDDVVVEEQRGGNVGVGEEGQDGVMHSSPAGREMQLCAVHRVRRWGQLGGEGVGVAEVRHVGSAHCIVSGPVAVVVCKGMAIFRVVRFLVGRVLVHVVSPLLLL
jgi:hypothetical protein